MPNRHKSSAPLHLVQATAEAPPTPSPPMEARKHPLARFDGKALVKIADAAAALEMSRATIYRINAAGRLPFVSEGRAVRVKLEDLQAYLDRMPAFDGKRAAKP